MLSTLVDLSYDNKVGVGELELGKCLGYSQSNDYEHVIRFLTPASAFFSGGGRADSEAVRRWLATLCAAEARHPVAAAPISSAT